MPVNTISFILGVCLIAASASAQRHLVTSFYTKSNISDSLVSITSSEFRKDNWEPRGSYTKAYFYKNHKLIRVEMDDDVYHIRYRRKNIVVMVFAKKKKVRDYIYVYDSAKRIKKANHYEWEDGKKTLWGVEHFNYDSSRRLTSANYVVVNPKSMHPGYEHSCSYVYDDFGRVLMEIRGYREAEYFYNEENELSYSLVHDNEFGKRQYKNVYTIIVK